MKKKPKLIFKINRNNTAKIYVGGKWQKDVTRVQIYAEPLDHDVWIEQIKRNEFGGVLVENDDLVRDEKHYQFKAGG